MVKPRPIVELCENAAECSFTRTKYAANPLCGTFTNVFKPRLNRTFVHAEIEDSYDMRKHLFSWFYYRYAVCGYHKINRVSVLRNNVKSNNQIQNNKYLPASMLTCINCSYNNNIITSFFN